MVVCECVTTTDAVKPVEPAGVHATAKTAVAGSAMGMRNAATMRDKRRVFFESLFFILDVIVIGKILVRYKRLLFIY